MRALPIPSFCSSTICIIILIATEILQCECKSSSIISTYIGYKLATGALDGNSDKTPYSPLLRKAELIHSQTSMYHLLHRTDEGRPSESPFLDNAERELRLLGEQYRLIEEMRAKEKSDFYFLLAKIGALFVSVLLFLVIYMVIDSSKRYLTLLWNRRKFTGKKRFRHFSKVDTRPPLVGKDTLADCTKSQTDNLPSFAVQSEVANNSTPLADPPSYEKQSFSHPPLYSDHLSIGNVKYPTV